MDVLLKDPRTDLDIVYLTSNCYLYTVSIPMTISLLVLKILKNNSPFETAEDAGSVVSVIFLQSSGSIPATTTYSTTRARTYYYKMICNMNESEMVLKPYPSYIVVIHPHNLDYCTI